jgi:two-component system response regulator QseB
MVQADRWTGKRPSGGRGLESPVVAFTIMIVEDEPAVARGVQVALEREGYGVTVVGTGEEAVARFGDLAPDLVLLDVRLPGIDGFEVCRQIRRESRAPILFLTARTDEVDKVVGLEIGADDYLVKPFSLDELGARMRALLRRDIAREDNVIRHGDLALDAGSRSVTRAGTPVDVSAREFALLEALLERPGTALSKAQLEERLYGWGEEVESNTVEVHVHNLRKKLGAEAIRTIRGVGYVIGK